VRRSDSITGPVLEAGSAPGRWEVWVDTGGTFTDCVARGPDGSLHRTKVLSTSALRAGLIRLEDPSTLVLDAPWTAPADFPVGFSLHVHGSERDPVRVRSWDPETGTLSLDGSLDFQVEPGTTVELRSPEPAPLLAARLVTGTPARQALPDGLALRLATTRATNALLERRGARVALFTTRGFGDVLRIADQQRPDLFALDARRPEPLTGRVVEVAGRIAADGEVLSELELDDPSDSGVVELARRVDELLEEGVEAAAVVLLHAYRSPGHEERLGRFLRDRGMPFVAISSRTAPFLHLLRRAETTVVEAYLAPVIQAYVQSILEGLPGEDLLVMTSAGGLVRGTGVRARDTLLSGPAGGVVGAALVGRRLGEDRIIALDMGGTSTDVSRVEGDYEYVEEHRVGPARLRAPALGIETVAAGGGSICGVDANGLRVGPESAGARPGPACYGAGGPLTLTDVNLLLGRIDPVRFQIPVDRTPAERRMEEVRREVEERSGEDPGREELLEGFLELANERMADAIRRISVRKGYDPARYALVAFGGAGPQHACAVARRLGMQRILVPADAGVLSAVGLGHAVVERFAHRQVLRLLEEAEAELPGRFQALEEEARRRVREEGVPEKEVVVRQRTVRLRYLGQESTLEVPFPPDSGEAEGGRGRLRAAFEATYEEVYGHRAEGRAVEVESLRVVASARPREPDDASLPPEASPPACDRTRAWFNGDWREVPVWERDELAPGTRIAGPALIRDRHSSLVVESDWEGRVASDGTLALAKVEAPAGALSEGSILGREAPRAVTEELFVQRFRALVGEMGDQLRRTALSVNIRERLDFSCALLDPAGRLVANAPHIPVHLGAMGMCVRSLNQALPLGPGDVAVTNHPGYGGSHLPDVTVITPVYAFAATDPRLLGYVASRAHHAEIGGSRPGSMPPGATSLREEGVVIPPTLLVSGGRARWEEMRRILSQADFPSRTVEENLVDLSAQVAANHRGARLLRELARSAGPDAVLEQMNRLRARAARRMEDVLSGMGDGRHTAREELDDGTPLQVEIRVERTEAQVDFSGSGGVHPGNLNATEAIVRSAVLYLLRLLAGEELPLNEGLMEPIRLHLPEGLLNPPFQDDPARCPAVVGGNVETSQRLVDTLLKAFELAGCSQGTMNNVLFGDAGFSYYETVGGGAGAGPGFPGAHATQVHMTNTRITDVEVMEHRFPVRVERFQIRRGSGGAGRWPGGDGVIRELRFLRPLEISVLTQHRRVPPYGVRGGSSGDVGSQRLIRASGRVEELDSIDGRSVAAGDRLVLMTPGGGGYGPSEDGPRDHRPRTGGSGGGTG
jgi:5-oxoprolinase (ATP-hydrolysing)